MMRSDKYTAQIERVVGEPFSANAMRQGYLGVSIGHPNFTGRRLRAILRWLHKNIGTVRVVIGDDLARHNFVWDCVTGDAALKSARDVGNKVLKDVETEIRNAGLSLDRFSIVRWRNLIECDRFTHWRTVLQQITESELDFHMSLAHSAADYVDRRSVRQVIPASRRSECEAAASEYILEEIAAFCVLAEDGFTTDVYPGPELEILTSIANGKFPYAPAPLLNRTSVALRITKLTASVV